MTIQVGVKEPATRKAEGFAFRVGISNTAAGLWKIRARKELLAGRIFFRILNGKKSLKPVF